VDAYDGAGKVGAAYYIKNDGTAGKHSELHRAKGLKTHTTLLYIRYLYIYIYEYVCVSIIREYYMLYVYKADEGPFQ